jgi:hypothetical protein
MASTFIQFVFLYSIGLKNSVSIHQRSWWLSDSGIAAADILAAKLSLVLSNRSLEFEKWYNPARKSCPTTRITSPQDDHIAFVIYK